MQRSSSRASKLGAGASAAAIALVIASTLGAAPAVAAGGYTVTNLVSDQAGVAAHRDRNLVNAWGLAAGPTTFWWVADNGTDVSTLYDENGTPQSLVVSVTGAPTGAVFNGGSGFVVSHEGQSGPSLFLFANESGRIRGWNPSVGTTTPPSTRTFTVVNRSGKGAIFKGLAIASTAGGDFLYATDFHNATVDVFDSTFHQVRTPGAFDDPSIPDGFAPFGIQNIGGSIFVTYAKQDAAAEDDVAGRGLGFVDMYDPAGTLLERVATRTALNAPWGLAMAPNDFGGRSGDLLVGNFGDGKIHAYDLSTNPPTLDGAVRHPNGDPVVIDGLWALEFGNGSPNNGPTNTLFFTAGPADETHGLFGTIEAAS
jgi:uncharacterized protein (TIGR03118 family)